jgi:hypothetical protein
MDVTTTEEGNRVCQLTADEVYGEADGRAIKLIARDGPGDHVEVRLDVLQLADLINDAGVPVFADGRPAGLSWDPEANGLSVFTGPHPVRSRPTK